MKPHPSFALTLEERREFGKYMKSVKFPDGFASNLTKNVNDHDGKITGLKSHDCHVIMQRLLIPGIRKYLPKEVSDTVAQLCSFFKLICSRTLKVDELRKAQKNVSLILCKLELIFPPAFFDIMVHLVMHLPEEAIQGGPVHSRWMYPFERYIGTLKQYVKNRARPEGSIAEGYIVNEALTFCSMYFRDIETAHNRPERHQGRNDTTESKTLSVFNHCTRLIGKGTAILLDEALRRKAQWYILNNCDEVDKYKE